MFRPLTTTMSRLSYNLRQKGQLNLPGITAASKKLTEDLLLKDAEDHHGFFRASGFHNHLSHHILAAYDMGATPHHLQHVYDKEAAYQRPRVLEEKDKSIVVNKDNWVQYLGNQSAYGAFVTFFSEEVKQLGVTASLEKYVYNEDVNKEGITMLTRAMSGALHPFILLGYGAEFGNDTLIATGLAQTAIHVPVAGTVFDVDKNPPSQSITLLELLRKVYDSDILHPPMPYDPDAFVNARMKKAIADGRGEELVKLCGLYHISDNITDAELAQKTEECICLATLLFGATGKKGRKPRLDFFLMHLLTSSLFLRPMLALLRKAEHKAALLRAYVPVMLLITLARGRPRIDPELLMSYSDVPRPPSVGQANIQPGPTSTGNPGDDADFNPWPALIEGALYHPDSHVLKAMRTLIFAAQHFGDKGPGEFVGACGSGPDGKKEETHVGISKVDGTVFVRAAGVMMDNLGWLGRGQKEGEWDRSALGWEAAWDSGD
ncbi:hypothetical protein M413DRAFT_409215 [Hebeloma cylindrosporum]|uniref:Uncharacterized protein n=1 Tax=Hebeloma cylindrosporum TaxID=76867 RepID=A0A0C2YMB6_HEBCY|nr:hypothetical protein M413DRAFT_409215 [Hebeloma cylindrosporum h7]